MKFEKNKKKEFLKNDEKVFGEDFYNKSKELFEELKDRIIIFYEDNSRILRIIGAFVVAYIAIIIIKKIFGIDEDFITDVFKYILLAAAIYFTNTKQKSIEFILKNNFTTICISLILFVVLFQRELGIYEDFALYTSLGILAFWYIFNTLIKEKLNITSLENKNKENSKNDKTEI